MPKLSSGLKGGLLAGLSLLLGLGSVQAADPQEATDVSRLPSYSTRLDVKLNPTPRQAVLVPPDLDPQAFAQQNQLQEPEVVRIPGDHPKYGGWALLSFRGTEGQAKALCRDHPKLGFCELDRCREFLPASELGTLIGESWRPEKEFVTAMAETAGEAVASAGSSPSGQATASVALHETEQATATIWPAPPTPEQLVKGETSAWGPDAAKGLDVHTLRSGTVTTMTIPDNGQLQVGAGWDQTTARPPTGGTIARPPGGGTQPRPPKPPVPPETPENPPGLVPPPPPFIPTPPEENIDDVLACKLFGGGGEVPGLGARVGLPDVKEFIEPPPREPGQEGLNDPAIAGDHVWLHDLSFFYFSHDLYVQSIGVDFNASRFYRSNIKTKEGGLFGYNWDFAYYKRLIPQGGALNPKLGLRVEGLMNPGPVLYMRGNGRVEEMKPSGVRFQMVKNFGGRFDAWVTYYQPPDNLFTELERYVLLPNQQSPFAGHPNYEGDIFYVMRYGNGYREVYSCRGILLYILDRHDNRMTFEYAPVFHPLTFNPKLEKITDTAGRKYVLEWTTIEGNGLVHTNYKGEVISGTFPKLRLKKVREDFGADSREVEYHYRGGDSRPVLEKAEERKDGNFITTYSYTEQDTRYYLETLTLPRESALGGDPYLKNQWRQDGSVKRIQSQTHGRPGTGTRGGGFEGGMTLFQWEGKPGSRVTVQGPRGGEEVYTLEWTGLAYVVRRIDLKLDDGRVATTTIQHNKSDQVTILTRPEGNRIEYQFAAGGGPVTEGPIRDCLNCGGGAQGLTAPSVSAPSASGLGTSALGITSGKGGESGVTYLNNLARGNLTLKILHAGDRPNPLPYSSITTSYTYEPLYNQFKRIEGPGEAVTEFDYDYFTAGAEGNPIVRRRPRRTTAKGETLGPIETAYTYSPKGLLLQETDPLGHKTVYGYDGNGYLVSVADDGDLEDNVSFGRDLRGNMIKYTDARGTITMLKVDKRDLVREKVEDEQGFKNRTSYVYDQNGNLILEQIAVNDNVPSDGSFPELPKKSFQVTKTYQYNLLNLLTKETQLAQDLGAGTALSRERTQAHDGGGNLVTVQEPEGFMISYQYDAVGNVTQKTFGGKLAESYRYDLNGNLIEKTRGAGSTTIYEPDPFDRPYKTILPEGTTLVAPLNPDGTTQKVDIQGKNHEGKSVRLRFLEFKYDEIGDRIETQEHIFGPDGFTTGMRTERLIRDAEGKVRGAIDARKNESVFQYEGHRKSQDTDPLLNEVHYSYEPGGLPTSIKEIEREVVFEEIEGQPKRVEKTTAYAKTMSYDALGRLSSLTVPGGAGAAFAYDSLGNVRAKLENGGRLDLFEFDGFGRGVRDEQFANLGHDKLVVSRAYDLQDRLVSSTVDRGGRTISTMIRKYDAAGLLERLTVDGQSRTYRKYDDRGNAGREERSDGVKLDYTYDREDRATVITVEYPDHSVGRSTRETFAYDGLGRIVEAGRYGGIVTSKMTYDSVDNVRSEEQIIHGSALRLDYAYDAVGSRTELRGPSVGSDAAWTIQAQRDTVGRVYLLRHRVSGEGEPAKGVAYEYTGPVRVARRSIGGIEDTVYSYDAARRPIQAMVYSSAGRVATFGSGYDADSRALSQESHVKMLFESEGSETTALDYMPWGARGNVSTVFQWSDKPTDTNAKGTSRRLYRYDNDRIETIFSAQDTFTNRPGVIYGRKENRVSAGEMVKFVYDGDRLARTEFWQHEDLDAGLTDVKLKATLINGAVKKYTTWFRYDPNGSLSEDNRFRYEYGHQALPSQVTDKYTFGLNFEMTATQYYDFADRLVYIEYGPKTRDASRYIDPIFPDRRILYDDRLPFLEIATQGKAVPKQVEVAYVTHPEGSDVGPIRVRTHYDVLGAKEPPPSVVYPFFDLEGSLALVFDPAARDYYKVGQTLDSAVRTSARRRHVILPRLEKDTRPEDLVALRPEHPRREIPLMGLRARWDPFLEAAFDLENGRLIPDPMRNLELRLKTAQQARSDYLNEQINEGQKKGLMAMGALSGLVFFPVAFMEYPAATALGLALDVAVDMAVTEVLFKEEYGVDDLGQTLAYSGLFAGSGMLGAEFAKLRNAKLFDGLDDARRVRMSGKASGSVEPGMAQKAPDMDVPDTAGPSAVSGHAARARPGRAPRGDKPAAPSRSADRPSFSQEQDYDPVGWPSFESGRLALFRGIDKEDGRLRRFAENLAPVPGVFDIMVHGSPKGFEMHTWRKFYKISPETLASMARARGFRPGMVVRLISCDSGAEAKGAAQLLADALDTRVFAPNRKVWAWDSGKFTLDGVAGKVQGNWLEFVPTRVRAMPTMPRWQAPWLPNKPYRPRTRPVGN
ncbi:MAG: hypothetical protein AB1555_18480 [Nitrospirota bacterium]